MARITTVCLAVKPMPKLKLSNDNQLLECEPRVVTVCGMQVVDIAN